MNSKKNYTAAQLDLLRRIEGMEISDELRQDIEELKRFDSEKGNSDRVIRGETRIVGFRPNPK